MAQMYKSLDIKCNYLILVPHMNPKKKAELQHLLDQKLEELSRKRKQPHVIPEPIVLGVDGEIFRNFDTLKANPGFALNDYYNLGDERVVNLYFFSTTTRVSSKHGVHDFYDMHGFCAFPIKTKFGRTIIRSETILDKVAEFFSPCEHDFDQFPEFSSKFCCFSNDPLQLQMALRPEITKTFLDMADKFQVEFGFDYCVITNQSSIEDKNNIMRMAEFATVLHHVIR